ncbi:MAG: MBL fold metallo-hydrolase [Terracidiphilus sp.]|jgi:glyoxylase-like metal-dependent hydrolase (beta-lactamase superfamily II)
MNRRDFMQLGVAAGAAAMLYRTLSAQAAPAAGQAAQPRSSAADTPIKTTMLHDNVYLLQGQGGNMALQTGPEGNILIDASFTPAVPRILEAIAAIVKDAPFALINTHWHGDHTGGNEGLHAAGYTIVAHRNTRERLSMPQTMKIFHSTTPAAPAGAWPTVTFEDALTVWRNGDALNLVHLAPAHTDTDIYIHFHKANVLHVGDIWFNGIYPFIDEGTGGSIGGMIRASEKVLAVVDNDTKIIPGHGPLGTKADFQKYHEMLATIRDKVAALKASGTSEQEVIAKKPTAEFDATLAKGFMDADTFTGIVYRTL